MSTSILVPRRSAGTTINIIQGAIIGILLTLLSYAIGIGAGWIDSINYLEAFAVVTSYACTFLCVMERRSNYPIGVITNIAYCVLFAQWGLYASAAVTGYLSFALAYGWVRWKSDSDTRPVARVEPRWIPMYLLSTAVFYGLAAAIVSLLGGTLALTDTVILIGTLLAQFLLDNKKIETWAVWAVVNVFAIYTYLTAGLYLAGFQYVFFLLNTLYGYYTWRNSDTRTSIG